MLKHKFYHDPKTGLEVAKDWARYVEALLELKHAHVMLDVGDTPDDFLNRTQEPGIIRFTVEKKFKSMLGDDWEEFPPGYGERMEAHPPELDRLGCFDWKILYGDSLTLHEDLERREKHKQKYEAKKANGASPPTVKAPF